MPKNVMQFKYILLYKLNIVEKLGEDAGYHAGLSPSSSNLQG